MSRLRAALWLYALFAASAHPTLGAQEHRISLRGELRVGGFGDGPEAFGEVGAFEAGPGIIVVADRLYALSLDALDVPYVVRFAIAGV